MRKIERIEEIKLKLGEARSLSTDLDGLDVLVYFIELAMLEAEERIQKLRGSGGVN